MTRRIILTIAALMLLVSGIVMVATEVAPSAVFVVQVVALVLAVVGMRMKTPNENDG